MNAGVVKHEGDRMAAVPADEERADDDLDEAVAIFVRARPRLLAIAYRILRSTSEAEDVAADLAS